MGSGQSTQRRRNWMPASGIKLLDANVWLALAFSDHVHHELARQWFDSRSDGTCAFCRLTQMALLRHLTNAKIMGTFVQSQQQAWMAYDGFVRDSRVVFVAEPVSLDVEFRGMTQSASPGHQRWSDAYLAAMSKLHNAELATFDRGLSNYPGVHVLGAGEK
jgi:uncharacterized protein